MVGRLFDSIRSLVLRGCYVVGEHAVERLEERGILEWQVVEVQQLLANGTAVKAVWSHVVNGDYAKLVTVYYLDK